MFLTLVRKTVFAMFSAKFEVLTKDMKNNYLVSRRLTAPSPPDVIGIDYSNFNWNRKK